MRNHSLTLAALAATMLLAGCQGMPGPTSAMADDPVWPVNPQFAGEKAKFDAQFPNDKVSKYEAESIAYNNAQKLDERNGCHEKAKNPITIILLLDASGKVSNSVTDVENPKAACFRQTYAAAQFPRPPIAPYRKAILLR